MSIETFTIASLPLVGSGTVGICRLPGLSRALASDVATLVAWQPSIVVSLTELAEMAELGAGQLPALIAAHAIAWAHFPVEDFGVPSKAADSEWSALSTRLHNALDQGQNVVLHCRGGLGRSGMVALRLLVERGEGADAALERLRAVRPGAIETAEQMNWAKSSIV